MLEQFLDVVSVDHTGTGAQDFGCHGVGGREMVLGDLVCDLWRDFQSAVVSQIGCVLGE